MAGMVLFLWLLAIPLSWMPEPIGPAAELFATGAWITLKLTVISGLAGILIGFVIAMAKLSRIWPVRWFAQFYIWVLRGTPLIVQLYFVCFALPDLIPLQLSDVNSAIVALALNVGAYNAEAIRAGIMAVHKGQSEAARSLGLSPWQTFTSVVFPQSFRIALPALVNNFVSLLKDSSLASVIGVVELMTIGSRLKAETFQPAPVLTATAIIYLAMTTIMTQISNAIERQLDVQNHQ